MSRRAAPIAVLLAVLAGAAPAAARGPDETFLINAPTGLETPLPAPVGSSFASQSDGISANGRYVVFTSRADGMSTDDDDRYSNVFVRDNTAGVTSLVSKTAGGGPARGNSSSPALSANEASPKVAFTSAARLTFDDFDDADDVYVRDLVAGTITLVSRRTDGLQPTPGSYIEVAISDDGDVVAFSTDEALDPADTGGSFDVYTRDLDSLVTTRESIRDTGAQPTLDGAPTDSFSPDLNQDGTWISFSTKADNIDTGVTDTNDTDDVVARLRGAADENTIVSMANGVGAATTAGRSGANDITGTGAQPYVAFASAARLVAADPVGDTLQDIYRRQVGTSTTTLISVNSAEVKSNGFSELPALGDDPNEILFSSSATNLTGEDTNGRTHVYLRDGGDTELVSREGGLPPAPIGERESRIQSLSANGNWAVFGTDAANLAPGAGQLITQVVRRKLTILQGNTVMSTLPGGETENPGGRAELSRSGRTVSSDGRYVAFESAATALSGEDAPGAVVDVFRRDVLTGETLLVSRADGAAGAGGDADSGDATISSDGSRVAFISRASNLTSEGAGPSGRAYVRAIADGSTVLAGRADGAGGGPADYTDEAAISGDGRRVAFVSSGDIAGEGVLDADAFVRDLAAGTTVAASVADGPGGALGSGPTSEVAIDTTGNRVAFISAAPDLGDGDTDALADVHVRDLGAGSTRLASRSGAAKADAGSFSVSISGNGQRVAFVSEAGNLSPDNPDASPDVYMHDLAAGTTDLVSRANGGAPLASYHQAARISLDGGAVAFETFADEAVPGDTGPKPRAVVRKLASGELLPIARANGAGGVLPDASASRPDLDADGACAVFQTSATNLAAFPVSPDASNVWMRVLGAGCPDPPAAPRPPGGAGGGGPASAAGGGPGSDTVRPVLSAVSMSRTRFRVGPRPTALVAQRGQARQGTAFRFTSSEAGTLRIAVALTAPGRKVGKRCRKPTKQLRGRKECTRLVAAGTLRRAVAAGRGSVAFSGRMGRKKLRRGPYRASLSVTDAAANRSAARRLSFRIVR